MPNHLLEKKGSNINGGQLAQLLLKMNRRYVLMKKTTNDMALHCSFLAI